MLWFLPVASKKHFTIAFVIFDKEPRRSKRTQLYRSLYFRVKQLLHLSSPIHCLLYILLSKQLFSPSMCVPQRSSEIFVAGQIEMRRGPEFIEEERSGGQVLFRREVGLDEQESTLVGLSDGYGDIVLGECYVGLANTASCSKGVSCKVVSFGGKGTRW